MPSADSQDHPSAGDGVDRGEGLGDLERVPVCRNVDVAEQSNIRGDPGQPGEGCDGVPPLGPHRLRLLRWDGDVIAHAHIEEAGTVCGLGHGGQFWRSGVLLPGLHEVGRLGLDRELHAHDQSALRQDGPHELDPRSGF